MTENYSAFKDLDLNNARNENETREEYNYVKKGIEKYSKYIIK